MSIRLLLACLFNVLVILGAGGVWSQQLAERPAAQPPASRPVMVASMTKKLFDELTACNTPYQVTKRQTWQDVHVIGKAVADAKARFSWDTSGENPVLVVRLFGEVETQLTLDAEQAVGYARATTQFDASRRITFDGTQFIDGEVSSEADSHTTLQRVCSRRGGLLGRIIRGRAWEELRSSKSDITQVVDHLTEDFVLERLDVEAKAHFYYDLGRVGILEDALKHAYPEAASFQYRLSSDEECLYVTWGPKDMVEMDLSTLASRSAGYPLTLRVRMNPAQMLLAQTLLVSDNSQHIVRAFMPEAITHALEDGIQVNIVDEWLAFDLSRQTIDSVVKALPR